MSISKHLPVSRYLTDNPKDLDVAFSFPDDRQLRANRMLLSLSSDAFQAMLSGDWKEEEVIHLPDTNLEAFEAITKYLYSEEVDLTAMSINQLDSLFHLADKYLIEEIKGSIIKQTENWLTLPQSCCNACNLQCNAMLSVIKDLKTDPIKEAATKGIIKFLGQRNNEENQTRGAVQCLFDVEVLAEAYGSGMYDESIMEGMVKAVVIFLIDPKWDTEGESTIQNVAYIFDDLPETDECCKFMFKVMKMLAKMGNEEQPSSWGGV